MVNWLLVVMAANTVKFGLAISSMSYHPDYSKLSLYNLIVIAGALVNITIVLLAIIILYIMRPETLSAIEREQISQISLAKKRPIKLLPVEETQKSEKVWQFHPIEISATSTNSKTGEEPIFTQITGADDYLKSMPELPSYMTHVGDDQPVVFHFKEKKPEVAILPVYLMKNNGNDLVSPATVLKTSVSQPKELVRLLTASTATTTTRSSSMKKGSATSSSTRSSSSAMKKSVTGKDASGMMASEENKKSKTMKPRLIESVNGNDDSILSLILRNTIRVIIQQYVVTCLKDIKITT